MLEISYKSFEKILKGIDCETLYLNNIEDNDNTFWSFSVLEAIDYCRNYKLESSLFIQDSNFLIRELLLLKTLLGLRNKANDNKNMIFNISKINTLYYQLKPILKSINSQDLIKMSQVDAKRDISKYINKEHKHLHPDDKLYLIKQIEKESILDENSYIYHINSKFEEFYDIYADNLFEIYSDGYRDLTEQLLKEHVFTSKVQSESIKVLTLQVERDMLAYLNLADNIEKINEKQLKSFQK